MQPDEAPLFASVRQWPCDSEDGRGAHALERLVRHAPHSAPIEAILADKSEVKALLSGAFAGSSFLLGLAQADMALLERTLSSPPRAHLSDILRQTRDAAANAKTVKEIMTVLRQAKARTAFLIALCDLSGAWTVDEVTAALSEAADCFVQLAVSFLLVRAAEAGRLRPPDPLDPQAGSGLIVLGMGKLGAHELNYSSDIDLIVFYDAAIAPLADKSEASPFFVRLARDLVHILQERTADGYVYRTDLRLRPDPGSTQAAISVAAALNYYEGQGQNWERAALIKARSVAGDRAAGEDFLAALRPYIWRKYLDYNAILDIHAMKRQIHAAKGHAQIAVLGHNVKVGRGGIREIEFFVQSQQLIAGGRQPSLRTPMTIDGLEKLHAAGWIGEVAARELKEAYRFLRRLEHRLQMVADQQTHTLPKTDGEFAAFARFCGYDSAGRLEADLRRHMQNVRRHYGALFEEVPELTPKRVKGNLVFTGETDDPNTLQTLSELGFRSPSAAIAAIKSWHYGRYRAMRSERAREILTDFTPALLEAFGETADPDLALSTFDRFLSELPSAVQLFSMLRSNPPLLRLIALIMGSAPRLARILSRRRRIMDVILDPGCLGTMPTREELAALVQTEILAAPSYEEQLNRARVVGQEQAFLIGAGLLSRALSPLDAATHYTRLAEVLIEALVACVHTEFAKGEGLPPPAVIAMGKLGGREMTATSDLDLIIVYQTPPDTNSNAPQYYARFTQRLIAALSAHTAEGQLYAVDMRLRPSGKAGPVAVAFEGFSTYQHNEAWTWEHLALSRARVIAGPSPLRERLAGEIHEILVAPRNAAKAKADVRDMRALIAKEKGSGNLWDVKNHNGGLIDVEFIAQYLQIVHASAAPEILDQNTLAAIHKLKAHGALAPAHADALAAALELYQGITQILRLCTEGPFDPAQAPKDLIGLLTDQARAASMAELEERLAQSYRENRRIFEYYIGPY